jgi:hypothetical protein
MVVLSTLLLSLFALLPSPLPSSSPLPPDLLGALVANSAPIGSYLRKPCALPNLNTGSTWQVSPSPISSQSLCTELPVRLLSVFVMSLP